MDNFDFVSPEWIKEQLTRTGLKNGDLATALNVSDSQISQWLTGNRNPTAATKAAMYYYFGSLELDNLKNGKETLKLSTMQYLAVKIPGTKRQYTILWNHYDSNLIVHKCEIDEMKYIDLTRYKYLLINPEHELYSILYEFDIKGDLRLNRKVKSELAEDFEVVYGY